MKNSELHNLIAKLISQQKSAIRYHCFFAIGIVTLGIVLIITDFINISPEIPDSFKNLVKIGGAFISTLSGFQIKEIINRREKISIFETLDLRLSSSDEPNSNNIKNESDRIEEIVWKTIEKIAIG